MANYDWLDKPVYGEPYVFYTALVSQADTDIFQVNPTLAAGDVKVSLGDGALNNLATLPTVSPAGSKRVKISLSAAEMSDEDVTVIFSDAAGNEWQDQFLHIQPLNGTVSVPSVADNADAVWDEAIADHVVAGSVGKKLDETCCSLGSGVNTNTYTVTDSLSGDPLPDVTVAVTTDILGTNVIAQGVTDDFGQVTFYLDSGTYYMWSAKAGYSFTNPDTEVVS